MVTTSLRQSWTRTRRCGKPGNMRSNCQSGIATWVPRAGITSTSFLAEVLVGQAGQRPGHAVGTGEIGRQGQHPLPGSQGLETPPQCSAEVFVAEVGGRRAFGVIERHRNVPEEGRKRKSGPADPGPHYSAYRFSTVGNRGQTEVGGRGAQGVQFHARTAR